MPELILAAFRAMERGEAKSAGDLQRAWYPLRELARRHGQPQTTKAAMNARGFKGGSVRPPLIDLQGKALDDVAQALKTIATLPGTGLRAA